MIGFGQRNLSVLAIAAAYVTCICDVAAEDDLQRADRTPRGTVIVDSGHGYKGIDHIINLIGPEASIEGVEPGRAVVFMSAVPDGMQQLRRWGYHLDVVMLSLRGVQVTDEDLRWICATYPRLLSLTLQSVEMIPDDELLDLEATEIQRCETLEISHDGWKAISSLQALQRLTVDGLDFNAADLEHLASMPRLIRLSILNSPLTDPDLEALALVPNLAQLDVPHSNVDGSFLKFFDGSSTLRVLDLSHTKTDIGLKETLHDSEFPNLINIRLAGCNVPRSIEVELLSMQFGWLDRDLARFSPPRPKSAQQIREYRAALRIFDDFIDSDFRFSTSGETVAALVLGQPGGSGGDWVMGYVKLLPGMKAFLANGWEFPDQAVLALVKAQPGLEIVRLDESRITDTGVEMLTELPQLAALSLRGTAITDEAADQLGVVSSISRLDVSNTAITDKGIASLRWLSQLRQLNIKGCKVSEASVPFLLELHELSVLAMDTDRVENDSQRQLKRHIKVNRKRQGRLRPFAQQLAN